MARGHSRFMMDGTYEKHWSLFGPFFFSLSYTSAVVSSTVLKEKEQPPLLFVLLGQLADGILEPIRHESLLQLLPR